MPLRDDYRDFLVLLNKHDVEYLTVGAFAVMYHGNFVRTSKDMDIWFRQTNENVEKLSKAVHEYSGKYIEPKTLLIPKQKIEIGSPEFKIELISYFERVNFDEAWRKKVQGMFWGVPMNFVPKDVLIEMKKLAGRLQDLADLERLDELSKIKEESKNMKRTKNRKKHRGGPLDK